MALIFVLALVGLVASGALLAAWAARALGVRNVLASPRRLRVTGDLAVHVGEHVALEGELVGGLLETSWPSASLPDGPHPAAPHTDVAGLAVDVAGVRVGLAGPVQVVVGEDERRASRAGGDVLVRSVPERARVLVEGRLARRADAEGTGSPGYRDGASAFTVVPHPIDGWPARPIAVYGLSRRVPRYVFAAAACLALGLAAGAGLVRNLAAPHETRSTAKPGRPACAVSVEEALAKGDPWRAHELASRCADLEARGHAAWVLGRIDEAAETFLAARRAGASFEPTAAEVESVMLAHPEEAAPLVRLLREHWYRGPGGMAGDVMGCLEGRLLPGLGGKGEALVWGAMGYACIASDHRAASAHLAYHHLPAWSLNDSGRYQPIRFLFGRDLAWSDDPFGEDAWRPCTRGSADSRAFCASHDDAQRALFAAWTDDHELFRSSIAALDAPLAALSGHVEREVYGGGGERLMLSQAIAVAANAAWAIGDGAAMRRFSPYGEAHARAVLEEHLALEAGTREEPEPSHSPSDYSEVDVRFLRAARTSPADVVARDLAAARFTNPARISAMVGPPARRELRAKVGAWAASGFVPPARGAGFFEVVRAHYERRVVARVTGEKALEERLGDVGRRFSAAAQRPHRFVAVVGLESLGVR